MIGGKRLKLFNDGRPNTTITLPRIPEKSRRSSLLSTTNLSRTEERRSSTAETSISYISQDLPERLSPDGGEDDLLVNDQQVNAAEEDLDSWSDWDAEENAMSGTSNIETTPLNYDIDLAIETNVVQDISMLNINKKLESLPRREITTDITQLDIKNIQDLDTNDGNEFNYFLDMEPVIEKTSKYFVSGDSLSDKMERKEDSKINLCLSITDDNHVSEDCWGDDLSWAGN